MSTTAQSARVVGTALMFGGMAVAAAAPAVAHPDNPTPEEVNFLNVVRGTFPGDDRQLVETGEQVCTLLAWAGMPEPAVSDLLVSQRGATPEQASNLVRVAHDIVCPYIP